jgi:hypothetical protein
MIEDDNGPSDAEIEDQEIEQQIEAQEETQIDAKNEDREIERQIEAQEEAQEASTDDV